MSIFVSECVTKNKAGVFCFAHSIQECFAKYAARKRKYNIMKKKYTKHAIKKTNYVH